MTKADRIIVSIEQGEAGSPRYISLPSENRKDGRINLFAGEYYTYATAAELLTIKGARTLKRAPRAVKA